MFYQDNHITLYNQDFRKNDLPDESVQMVCTSPPYWGLRKYSGEQDLVWGSNHCEHQFDLSTPPRRKRSEADIKDQNSKQMTHTANAYNATDTSFCSLCGAWKGAYGLEPTSEMYIHHTIEILRKIRRVLRKDGVVFWNIGDSYGGDNSRASNGGRAGYGTPREGVFERSSDIIKPKDLCLIPFRVAIAAQEDGWWVRSVIIWSKPNPMPESVTDRPTESHEYTLMLTKSKKYYWDADAVRENNNSHYITVAHLGGKRFGGDSVIGNKAIREERVIETNGRNIRSVWEFPTQPYPEAHFAVFPEKLPEICIKAATPEVGCCSKCGAPWGRVIEKREYPKEVFTKARRPSDGLVRSSPMADGKGSGSKMQKYIDEHPLKTLGWQPTCKCNADKSQSIVLDPFAGSGTTLWAAKTLNRKAIGFDTSEEYCELARKRNLQQGLL